MTARTSDVRWLLKDALRVVSTRKRLILGVFLIVALAISLAVVSVPTSYEVAGKLVVTRERGDLLVTPTDQRNFNFAVTAPTIQDMAVHAELLKNRSLVEAVVKQLGLDRGGSTSASEPVETILNGLTIQVVPNSNLIYVRYRSTDPVKGADIVNALLDRYREMYLRVRSTPGVTRFFEEERDKLAASLKKTEHTLTTFRHKTALASASTQVDAYSRRLAEAESEAIDAQYDLRESEQRAAVIKEELDREPERIQFSSTIRYNPMIQAMQERLLTLEMEEQHLLTLYTDTDRRVQDKRTEIKAQQQGLAEARARDRVPQSEVTQLNGRRRDLEVQYIAATLAVQKNAIRAESARTIAAEMHQRVRDLGVDDVRREALNREIQASSDAYLLYRKKAEEARLTSALDDNMITNVAIGEPASRQGSPVGPPKNLSLVFAIAVGLVSGVGAAFLRELFDRPLETEQRTSGPTR
jgi:succinoglycan biosynthesis transport protein ExoP